MGGAERRTYTSLGFWCGSGSGYTGYTHSEDGNKKNGCGCGAEGRVPNVRAVASNLMATSRADENVDQARDDGDAICAGSVAGSFAKVLHHCKGGTGRLPIAPRAGGPC